MDQDKQIKSFVHHENRTKMFIFNKLLTSERRKMKKKKNKKKHLACSHNLSSTRNRIFSPAYARVLPLGDHLTPNVQDDERSS